MGCNKVLKQLYNSEVNHEVRVIGISKNYLAMQIKIFDFILLIGEKEMSLNKIIYKRFKIKHKNLLKFRFLILIINLNEIIKKKYDQLNIGADLNFEPNNY